MKIEIQHRGSVVKIDKQENKNTSIKYELDKIIELIDATIEAINTTKL